MWITPSLEEPYSYVPLYARLTEDCLYFFSLPQSYSTPTTTAEGLTRSLDKLRLGPKRPKGRYSDGPALSLDPASHPDFDANCKVKACLPLEFVNVRQAEDQPFLLEITSISNRAFPYIEFNEDFDIEKAYAARTSTSSAGLDPGGAWPAPVSIAYHQSLYVQVTPHPVRADRCPQVDSDMDATMREYVAAFKEKLGYREGAQEHPAQAASTSPAPQYNPNSQHNLFVNLGSVKGGDGPAGGKVLRGSHLLGVSVGGGSVVELGVANEDLPDLGPKVSAEWK